MKLITDRFLPAVMLLYALSLLTSMAGMEIFSALAALLGLIVMAKDGFPKSPGLLHWIDLSLWLLLAIIIIGMFVNTPPPAHYLKIAGSARWIILFYLMRYALHMIWTPRYEKFILAFIGLFGLVGLYAVFQHFTGIDFVRHNFNAVQPFDWSSTGKRLYRGAGFIGGPMRFGHEASVMLCFPFALLLSRAIRNRFVQGVLVFSFIAILLGLWATETRGAWLGAVCGLLVISAYCGPRTTVGLLLALVLLIGGGMKIDHNIRHRIVSSFNLRGRSDMDRINIWRINLAMFKDYPVLGIGYNENERLSNVYFDKLGIKNGQMGHAHNNYLQYLSGTGILGFSCYLFFVVMFYWIAHQLWYLIPRESIWERGLVLSIIGAQVANAVGGLTECNFKDAEVRHLFLFILMGLSAIYWRYATQSQTEGRWSAKSSGA